jgi:inner membrane protein
MDPLTHALSGALLARATAPQQQSQQFALPLRTRVAAGFAAAAFPDLDLALRLIDTLTYLNWHQGPTHSLIMLPLWALLLSHLFSRLSRKQYSWRMFYLPVCLGIAIHIAGDLITSYGLMLFAPFSTERFSLPLAFVIDPWFSLIIIAGLVFSLIFPQQKMIAVCALIGLAGYVAALWGLHERARNIGATYVQTQALNTAEVHALPQPLSPFNWKIIISDGDSYHIAHVNLWHRKSVQQLITDDAWLLQRMAAVYQPSTDIVWQRWEQFGNNPNNTHKTSLAREAWLQPGFEQFRQFAVFPLLDRMDHSENGNCFWFFDLRFQFPELPPSFRYGMCRRDDQANWQMLRQPGLFLID